MAQKGVPVAQKGVPVANRESCGPKGSPVALKLVPVAQKGTAQRGYCGKRAKLAQKIIGPQFLW